MPREGVPYPERLVCSLKCAVARIEQALGLKMNSVNGVGPDGQGDVKLISDSSALSVTDDPVQHEVHLDLDTSLLPAADVNSVNGQTGVVVLDGDDLDGVTPGNSVNDDLAALKNADTTLQNNINAEALARSGADSTLQTNINAANAAISGKVGGSGNIGSDTKPIKIVNGDAVAVTDTLQTAQDVQNALDNYPSMLRTSGNQTAAGVKCINNFMGFAVRLTGTNVYEIFRTTLATDMQIYYQAYSRYGAGMGKLTILLDSNNDITTMSTDKVTTPSSNDGITTFYAYKDGSSLVVCVGNSASYNNYISITINTAMSGAGVQRALDITYIGTNRTASAVSAKVLQ